MRLTTPKNEVETSKAIDYAIAIVILLICI